MTGFTTYVGLRNIGKPKLDETAVVKVTSGTVGSMVGQSARLRGACMVGITTGAQENIDRLANTMAQIMGKSLTLRGFIQTEYAETQLADFLL